MFIEILRCSVKSNQSLLFWNNTSWCDHSQIDTNQIKFFFFLAIPKTCISVLRLRDTIRYGVPINWYYRSFLQLSSWSRCIFYFISLTSTVSSGRVLRRGRPGSTVLTGVRRAAVNRIVPLALVHNLYTPLVTACQGFILFWCYQ